MSVVTLNQLYSEGLIRLNQEGRMCTYCLLQIMNPNVAKECPYHLPMPIQTLTETVEPELKPVITEPVLHDNRGRPRGTIPKCSRCRRDGRSISPKRNGRCIECEYEEWWTE